MSFLKAIPLIGKVLDKVISVVDQAVPDKDLRERLKSEMRTKMLDLDFSAFEKELDVRAEILLGEIKGKSWLQRNWRPILMMTVVLIVANNYLIYPYLAMFTDKAQVLELPKELYNLMIVGVGGYIVGRSGEKIMKTYKNGGSNGQI